MPSYVKTAPTSNSPGPNAILSTTIMTVPMPSAVLDMRTVTEYAKNISSVEQRTPILESKDTTGPAAKSKPEKTTMTR